MGRLSPLAPLVVLTIALYGVFVSFHDLVHPTGIEGPSRWSVLREELNIKEFKNYFGLGNGKPEEFPSLLGMREKTPEFSWDTVVSSKNLAWHSCYPEAIAKMECARLSVPLNYSNPEGEQASIAMTRIKSALHGSPSYRGPILLNPGGPGGSGVDRVLSAGAGISVVVGPQFDVVGFDPRGVGRSLPAASFFDTHMERMLWESSGGTNTGTLHVLNLTSDGLAKEWARSNVVGPLAAKRADVLRHINTDHTARDMLSIVEAHGQEKLQYWGFSYGSVLGSTFAAMFPDRVGRLVIDGVVDVENYYEGLWSTNLMDADKAMNSFYSYCHTAGPTRCAFWADSPEDIKDGLYRLYAAIRERPIPINIFEGPSGEASDYGLIDYNLLRMGVFVSLYSPWASFSILAEALADLRVAVSSMNDTAVYSHEANQAGQKLFKLFHQAPMKCDDACGCGGPGKEKSYPPLSDAQLAIACNDGSPVPNTLDHLEEYFDDLNKRSEWGELWAGMRAGCIGWPDLPKDHFRGPLRGSTSHPLLVIGNTADPVTPLWAAKKTAKGFPGSVVLIQDSPGHCSFRAPSLCTQLHVRNYFVTGELPKPGTVCPVIGTPFSPPGLTESQLREYVDQAVFEQQGEEMTAEVKELMETVLELSQALPVGFPI